jgi:predicted ribosome quality control (RQC) complex YloA/Tae2 family protein
MSFPKDQSVRHWYIPGISKTNSKAIQNEFKKTNNEKTNNETQKRIQKKSKAIQKRIKKQTKKN